MMPAASGVCPWESYFFQVLLYNLLFLGLSPLLDSKYLLTHHMLLHKYFDLGHAQLWFALCFNKEREIKRVLLQHESFTCFKCFSENSCFCFLQQSLVSFSHSCFLSNAYVCMCWVYTHACVQTHTHTLLAFLYSIPYAMIALATIHSESSNPELYVIYTEWPRQ